MKGFISVGALGLLGLIMAVTNPNREAYNRFAAQEATNLIRSDLCQAPIEIPALLDQIVRSGCDALAARGQPQIQDYIAQNTEQQNFLFFSLYATTLPTHRIKTIGIFQQFYLYNVRKRSRTEEVLNE